MQLVERREMDMPEKTILFLDIDEVLSLADPQDVMSRFERFARGLPAWPIPLAYPLLRAIDQNRFLRPVWVTSWGQYAHLWNERAETRRWPVAYPLSRKCSAMSSRICYL
jgi:hypothetical protein